MTFEEKKERARLHAQKVKEAQQISKIKHKNDPEIKIPTHKLITGYLFVILNVVLIYALVSMWHFADLTHLGVIVTDIAGQVITFLIYSKHSTAQNTSGGIVFETAMRKANEVTQKEKDEAAG